MTPSIEEDDERRQSLPRPPFSVLQAQDDRRSAGSWNTEVCKNIPFFNICSPSAKPTELVRRFRISSDFANA